MDESFDADNIEISIGNIHILQEEGLGDNKEWDRIKKKIIQGKPLDESQRVYFFEHAKEYKKFQVKRRERQLEQIRALQNEGIGEKEHMDEMIKILENRQNLKQIDLEYLHAKKREYEEGVVTTTNSLEGKEIISYLGIVSGQAVIGLMFIKDAIMKLTDVVGGRSGILERNFRTAKDVAIRQMMQEAKRMGANAVVGVSVNFNPIEGKNKEMLMVIATGTAVLARNKTQ